MEGAGAMYLKTRESNTTAGGLVGNHTTDGTVEDLGRSTVVVEVLGGVGVHVLSHEGSEADSVSHH